MSGGIWEPIAEPPMKLESSELLVVGQRCHPPPDGRSHLVLGPDEPLAALEHLVGHASRHDDHAVEIADHDVAQADADTAERERLTPVRHAPARNGILRAAVAHEGRKADTGDRGGIARAAIDDGATDLPHAEPFR